MHRINYTGVNFFFITLELVALVQKSNTKHGPTKDTWIPVACRVGTIHLFITTGCFYFGLLVRSARIDRLA
mgnify:CR=1 FL=1